MFVIHQYKNYGRIIKLSMKLYSAGNGKIFLEKIDLIEL